MRGNPYLSRPVKAEGKGPFEFARPRRIVKKEVHIGNHKPTDHFAQAAKAFIPQEQLYDARKRQK